MYHMCVGACGGEKRVLALKLEFSVVVSRHVPARNQTLVFCRASTALSVAEPPLQP